MTVIRPDFTLETEAFARGVRLVAGVDEVGRGPLAGPVMAAAVCLVAEDIPEGLRDSKALSARRREVLAAEIRERAMVGLGEASTGEIEEMNILQASHLAMCRALAALPAMPDLALIDGNSLPKALPCQGLRVVKGDAGCLSIAAASIVAKVARDAVMAELAQHWPGYGWERNAGYPTRQHLQALRDIGVSPHHRRSFKPVHNILWQGKSVNP
ncbi:ribonuclease HII [Rhodovulum sp. MB263]|uniref:ribonuclease HII n=1 Tax=Rhodovulum sp. (strain MB263) TaxID=308754 RepID=UPI0009B76F12|nr:ribonuclease HII [Rhodovulum sp. MB263]ARC90414.1 ribonuclease HII [Rhodovulum sp. MB263]